MNLPNNTNLDALNQRLKEMQNRVDKELASREKEKQSRFSEVGEKYKNDPVGFVTDCITWTQGESLTTYQTEILGLIPDKKRLCVRACHGAGKSTTAALTILWFCLTRDALKIDWKCVVTASVSTQLRQFLWPEVRLWARKLRWDLIGRGPFSERTEFLTTELNLEYGTAMCISPEEPSRAEGAHAKSLMLVVDEAKAVPNELFDALEGAFSGAGEDTSSEAFALMISTPGLPVGRFFQVQTQQQGYEDWHPYWIRVEDVLAAGRLSQDFIENRRRQWGETSSVYIQRVLGQFSSEDADSLIHSSWVQAAIDRGKERSALANS